MKILDFELHKDGVYDNSTSTLIYSLGERGSMMHGIPKNASFGLKSNEYSMYTTIRDRIRDKHVKESGVSFHDYMSSQKNLHTRQRINHDLKLAKETDMPPAIKRNLKKRLQEAKEYTSPEHLKAVRRFHGAASVAKKFTNKAVKILVSEADPDVIKISRRYDIGSRGIVFKHCTHERMRQMFETFPVLALKAANATDPITSRVTHDMIIKGDRMKVICARLGLNKIFRKIRPQNAYLVVKNWAIFSEMHDKHRELFTDFMPTKTMEQYRWLKVMLDVGFAYQRIDEDSVAFSAWLCKAYSKECHNKKEHLKRYGNLMRDAYMDNRWGNITWEAAKDRQRIWHEEDRARRDAQRRAAQAQAEIHHAREMDNIFISDGENTTFPEQWVADYEDEDGYSISYIKDSKGLNEEGHAMHHCVGGYSHLVARGDSNIYSIKKDGKRVATLELRKKRSAKDSANIALAKYGAVLLDNQNDGGLLLFCAPKVSVKIGQLYGHCNKTPSEEVKKLADAWVRNHEET